MLRNAWSPWSEAFCSVRAVAARRGAITILVFLARPRVIMARGGVVVTSAGMGLLGSAWPA